MNNNYTRIVLLITFILSQPSQAEMTDNQRRFALFDLAEKFANCAAVYTAAGTTSLPTENEVAKPMNLSNNAKRVSAFIFQTIETGKKKELSDYADLVNAFADRETKNLNQLKNTSQHYDHIITEKVKACNAMHDIEKKMLGDMKGNGS